MQCDLLEIDHPQLAGLYRHWLTFFETGRLPGRDHFDVIYLKPWLGHLMIIKPLNNGADFQYKLYGTMLARIVGEDLTGRLISSLPENDRRINIMCQYHQAYRTGCADYKFSEKPVEKNYQYIHKLILPVSTDGQNVDNLIVGVYGKVDWNTYSQTGPNHSFTPQQI